MNKKPPESEEERRERLRRHGSKGGKARLKWEKWRRQAAAQHAGKQGGAPRRIDRQKVVELRAAGKKWSEIAEEMGISIPSVARILRQEGK